MTTHSVRPAQLAGKPVELRAYSVFRLRRRSPVHVGFDHLQQQVRSGSLLALRHCGEPPAHLVGKEQLVTCLAADHHSSRTRGGSWLRPAAQPSPRIRAGPYCASAL